MRFRRSDAARFALTVSLVALLLPAVHPARAVSREDAERAARGFLGAFLEAGSEAERYSAGGKLANWRTLIEKHFPGPGEPFGYEILAVKGSSKTRKVAAGITRGEASEIFYLDVDRDGKVTDFYTVVEALSRLVDELREVTGKITDLELNADSYAELETLMLEQQRVASRIKNLLWRHRQLIDAD